MADEVAGPGASLPDKIAIGVLTRLVTRELADRGLYSYELAAAVTAAGAGFCFRAPAVLQLPVLQWLPDGSCASYVTGPGARSNRPGRARLAAGQPVTALPGTRVRVVDYDIPSRGSTEVITLVTSVLDHQDITAPDLAAAYSERWEAEPAFDEVKTHQRGPAAILRSQSPDLVLQELHGLLVTRYAVRQLMTQAADQAESDPGRLSFTRALRIVRRQVTAQAAFSPLPPEPGHR